MLFIGRRPNKCNALSDSRALRNKLQEVFVDQTKAIELGDAAMDRELRADTVGYFAGGTFVLDSTRIFFWFDTVDDLVDYLIEAEPYIYDLQTPEREAYQTRIRESLIGRYG